MRIKLFIVDDEKDILELFSYVFAPESYEIYYFTNFAEFKEELEKAESVPDVVITDLVLREKEDGIYLIEYLNQKYPDIAVFVISGYLTRDRISKLDELEVVNVASKPFKMFEYSERVKSYVELFAPQ